MKTGENYMKKNRKCKGVVILCLLILFLALNAQYIRSMVSRHFKTISSADAIEQMEKALKEKYPDKSFRWISGDYVDRFGYYNDAYFTSRFNVDNQKDNIIAVTCSDVEYENLWDGKYNVFIDEQGYEKKTSLINRLCSDYTYYLRTKAGLELRKYATLGNISVESPFQKGDFEKILPNHIDYGIEFSPQLNLLWEFKINLQNHVENEDKTMNDIIELLEGKGFEFEKYHFIFVIDKEKVHYVYDRNQDEFYKSNN